MNNEIIKFEFNDALEEIQIILELIDKNQLKEVDFQVRVKHLLTHIYRGYNFRNAKIQEWPGKGEKEYQKGILPPSDLFDNTGESNF